MMDGYPKRLRIERALLLFFTGFIGVGAVFGSMMFFLDPQNGFVMNGILPIMRERLPLGELLFSNLIFSGVALLIVNGISNLTAFALLLKNRPTGYLLGWIFGITLMLWISIQFYVFAPVVYAIDVVFFLLGLFQFLSGYLAFVRFRQMQFQSVQTQYPNIGKNGSREAVVYFSRCGYVRRLASEEADRRGADLIELTTQERTRGDLGFLWCGRFAMHGWGMPIAPVGADIASYRKIYLFSPVWAFSIAAPVRQFLLSYGDAITETELTIVHFMRTRLTAVFSEPARMLGGRLTARHSVSCRFGRYTSSDR